MFKWGVGLEEFKDKNGCFDIILCSDLIYNDLSVEPLCISIKYLLGEKKKEEKRSQCWMLHVKRDKDLDSKLQNCFLTHKLQFKEVPIAEFILQEEIPHNEFVPPQSLCLFVLEHE